MRIRRVTQTAFSYAGFLGFPVLRIVGRDTYQTGFLIPRPLVRVQPGSFAAPASGRGEDRRRATGPTDAHPFWAWGSMDRTDETGAFRSSVRRVLTVAGLALAAGVVLSDRAGALEGSVDSDPPVDSVEVCADGDTRMHTLLEKTLFQVDVLTLEVCFGPETDARLDSLVTGRGYSEALADSVARVALQATDVRARIEFLRGVGLDRFLDGIRENLGKAREAGIVTGEEYDTIASGLPRWYAFLEERGIREGDVMGYRIRGDTLRTTFRGVSGDTLLDQTDVGASRRLSVLGGYFAPGSDFREGLVRSLLEREGGS